MVFVRMGLSAKSRRCIARVHRGGGVGGVGVGDGGGVLPGNRVTARLSITPLLPPGSRCPSRRGNGRPVCLITHRHGTDTNEITRRPEERTDDRRRDSCWLLDQATITQFHYASIVLFCLSLHTVCQRAPPSAGTVYRKSVFCGFLLPLLVIKE